MEILDTVNHEPCMWKGTQCCKGDYSVLGNLRIISKSNLNSNGLFQEIWQGGLTIYENDQSAKNKKTVLKREDEGEEEVGEEGQSPEESYQR
jgi:hypothetical protein